MVILHIASIVDNPFSGVCVAVPKHLISQSKFAEIGFINVNNDIIPNLSNQFVFDENFDLQKLPFPFSKPDLVVFHEVYRKEYLNIYPELIKHNVPYIIIPHGCLRDMAQRKKWLKKKVGNLLFFNRFINNAVAIQCLSEQEERSTKFGNCKFVGANGIDIPNVFKELFNKDSMDFLYIGRLEMVPKGLDIMVEAINSIKDFLENNNCHFSIYGPGGAGRAEALNSLIEKYDLKDLISLNSEISGIDKENRCLEADVFIQTSRHEGMPMGILEALSYGIPCLITEGTCLTDIVEEYNAGWTTKTDVIALADAIKLSVLERDKLLDKSNSAKRLIKDNFDWDKISKTTVEKYEELLTKG